MLPIDQPVARDIRPQLLVLALLLGGLIAAPIAAWLVSKLPARIMGIAVGGLIIMTNLRTLMKAGGVTGDGKGGCGGRVGRRLPQAVAAEQGEQALR